MKIAILTQPLGTNYGGIMQAWAMQQVLSRMGHEVITIDRQPDQPSMSYKAARLAYRTAMKAVGKRKELINFEKHLPTILLHTRSFIDQLISITEPLFSTQQLKRHFHHENYDAVIVGSDQVWRPKYSPNIYNFFLDFLETQSILRIAYAASFGADEWEFSKEQTERCAQLAKEFDVISMREDSGVEFCHKQFGLETQHVLDPTLLLEISDYVKLIGSARLQDKKEGIYTYFLDENQEKIMLAEKVSKETGEYICSYQSKYSQPYNSIGSIGSHVMPDPRSWLTGFANAKYVLTDSYHGMMFSIIFQKPFLVVNNSNRGSARFHSFLGTFNITERLLNKGDISGKNIFLDSAIDYTKVEARLIVARNKSLMLLNSIQHGFQR